MDALEALYEKPPVSHHFHDRKVSITRANTLLLGPRGSGKTALMLEYLSTLEAGSFLYVDLHDLRLNLSTLSSSLEAFCHHYPITLLAVDNYLPALSLPEHVPLLLSTTDTTLRYKKLEVLWVDMLDFEEFIAFSKRTLSSEHLFNLYANHGRSPVSVIQEEAPLLHHLQTTLKLELEEEQLVALFIKLALFQSRPLSLHHLYTTLKPTMKLSKDTLYSASALFQARGLLHLVPKYDAPKTPKKVYFNDFALKNALTFEKDFLRRFENIVFCELIKRRTEVFYTPRVDFYLPQTKEALACIPFLPPELILRRFSGMISHLKELGAHTLTVLSVGNEGGGEKEGVRCEILPFWEWALQN